MGSSSRAATATTSCRHALLGALIGAKLHACSSRLRNQRSSVSAAAVLLAVLLLSAGAAALPSIVVFFLPLLVSTSVCCGAAYMLVASASEQEGGAGEVREAVHLSGGGDGMVEVGLLQVYGGVNASAYGGRRDVQVGYFLPLRRGTGNGGWTKRGGADEDGEVDGDVVFAGRLLSAGGGGAALEEELVAAQVDRLAEGVWDSYFGGCSRWNSYDT